MDRYEVGHSTVRQALGMLKVEGLIDSVHGVGYFVRRTSPVRHRRWGSDNFISEAKAQGHEAEYRLLDVSVREPTAEAAAQLELEQGAMAVCRRSVRLLDGHPVQLIERWLPYELVKETRVPQNVDIGSRRELEASLEVRYTRFEEDLTVRMPTPQESEALYLPSGVPVIRLWRTAWATLDNDEEFPIDIIESILAGDRYVLCYGGSLSDKDQSGHSEITRDDS